MNIKGLKCDNPKCDFVDMGVSREDYLRYINYPCPKCGSPLLTKEDYDAVVLLERFSKNPIIKLLSLLPGKKTKFNINLHGKGFKDFNISEIKE